MSIGCFLAFSTVVVTELRMGESPYPVMLPVVALVLAALVVGAVRHGIEPIPRLSVTVTMSFALLVAYAAVSALATDQVIGGGSVELITLSKVWILPVLVQSLGVCLIALLGVALVRAKDLSLVLWWFAVAGAVVTPLGWLLNHEAPGGRLATRVGGAAVLHVALLIGLAVALAAWRQGYRPKVSGAVTGLYALYLLLSQSRAGLIVVGVFVVLVVAPPLVRGLRTGGVPRRLLALAGLTVAALVGMAVLVLDKRGVDTSGGGRSEAWVLAWEAVSASPFTLVFGTGYGTLWPWYAFEQGQYQGDVRAIKTMPHGETLAHAHNVYVAVGAELGLVGLLLLAPLLVAVVWAFRSATTRQGRWLAAALVATLPGFFFDTYLIKNFPLSLIWWAALFAVLRLNQLARLRASTINPPTVTANASAAGSTPSGSAESPEVSER